MALWWRCCWECGEFSFTCQCVQMQWVPNNRNVCNPHSSILWYIPWQDWTRFSTYRSQLKSQHTQSDCSAHPSAPKITTDPPVPHKTNHLLGPKPPQHCINRSDRVTWRKYPKLYRYSKWIFPSNRAISTLAAWIRANLKSRFLGRCRRFQTAVLPKSITRPCHRSAVLSDRSFTPSIVAYLLFTRRRRHISVQL